MIISEELKKFLDDPKVEDLINKGDWHALYFMHTRSLALFRDTGVLTTVLLKAGMNPLDSLSFVPAGYLFNTGIDKTVKIPDGVVTIEDCAFMGCEHLPGVDISESVKTIKRGAFFGCKSLASISALNADNIGDGAFNGTPITHVNLGNNIVFIGDYAFANCRSLKTVELGQGHMYINGNISPLFIGRDCFRSTSLETIKYNSSTAGWKEVRIDTLNEEIYRCHVICNDGSLRYDKKLKEWVTE